MRKTVEFWTPEEDAILLEGKITPAFVAERLPGRSYPESASRRLSLAVCKARGQMARQPKSVRPRPQDVMEMRRRLIEDDLSLEQLIAETPYHPTTIRHLMKGVARRHHTGGGSGEPLPRQIAEWPDLPADAFRSYAVGRDVRMSCVIPDVLSGSGSSLA